MDITRRDFVAGVALAAGACAFCGCGSTNKAPLFDSDADGVLPFPEALSKPGSQIRVRMPGSKDVVLVWRTESGFGGASITCTHKGCDVEYAHANGTLDCPCHGSRYELDGSVRKGPAPRPLRSYAVTQEGERLVVQAR